MRQPLSPELFAQAAQVQPQSADLIAQQQPTPLRLMRSADTYQQRFLKYSGIAVCHSYAELLHCALLEGERAVSTFVPQPYHLRVSGRWYIPDSYLVRGGERIVSELKPRGKFDEALQRPLEAFFTLHNMRFEVVANETVMDRETEALNWLAIVRTLVAAKAWDTTTVEQALWERVWREPNICLGDLVDSGDREASFATEVGVFRLLHAGRLTADLATRHLDYDTVVTICS